jgi:hypothetical protein
VFYTRLSPEEGDWVEAGNYGYCFRPRVSEDWRPYRNGHWVWTDRGWYWDSGERFGWATYHYGRWVDIRGTGWCWVPGNQWAPAWVSWRESDEHIGWLLFRPKPTSPRINRYRPGPTRIMALDRPLMRSSAILIGMNRATRGTSSDPSETFRSSVRPGTSRTLSPTTT